LATNPKGWPIFSLSEVAVISSGAGFPLEFQGQSDGDYPFYKVGDMNHIENKTEMRFHQNAVNELVRKKLRATAFPAGTIIFPKIGAAIATNKKRTLTKPSCVDNNVMAVTPTDRMDTQYLHGLFLKKNLSDFANIGNPPSIRKTVVEEWKIPLPPLSLQREYATRVAGIRTMEAAQTKSRRRLDDLFQSFLHRAFRGDL